MIPSPRLIALYLLVLLLHAGQALEHAYGKFWMVGSVLPPGIFLLLEWGLLAVAMVFFYYVLLGQHWAHVASRGYAVFMLLNGLIHNAGWLVTGRYFGGFAGAIAGWGLMLAAGLLYRQFRKDETMEAQA